MSKYLSIKTKYPGEKVGTKSVAQAKMDRTRKL